MVCDPNDAHVFVDAVDVTQGRTLWLVPVSGMRAYGCALRSHRVGDETFRCGAHVIPFRFQLISGFQHPWPSANNDVLKMKYLLLLLVALFTLESGYSEDLKKETAPSFEILRDWPITGHWKVGYSAENKEQAVHEYVTHGESVKKWTQLITEQYQKDIPAKLLPKYVDIIKGQLEKTSKGFVWKVLEKSENSITYEWSNQGSDKFPLQKCRRVLSR